MAAQNPSTHLLWGRPHRWSGYTAWPFLQHVPTFIVPNETDVQQCSHYMAKAYCTNPAGGGHWARATQYYTRINHPQKPNHGSDCACPKVRSDPYDPTSPMIFASRTKVRKVYPPNWFLIGEEVNVVPRLNCDSCLKRDKQDAPPSKKRPAEGDDKDRRGGGKSQYAGQYDRVTKAYEAAADRLEPDPAGRRSGRT